MNADYFIEVLNDEIEKLRKNDIVVTMKNIVRIHPWGIESGIADKLRKENMRAVSSVKEPGLVDATFVENDLDQTISDALATSMKPT